VGRDDESKPVLRLVMTEGCVDGIHEALAKLNEGDIAQHVNKHRSGTPGLREANPLI
jgi:hypothetical protein